ncbi:ATP-binding cassette domain-containing protein [Paenibacillus sp. J5C_2022]|uniref:ABC transporter ATP-binding protein n=1 Tax=Paenibacillus sp. J5C2022 TaxID=2977129 RepID=UPI0021D1BDB3|nr:ATP-binding cassette domain-containing protein [Paenibacillus sp. J5C2022]MCU6709559.1 ATP-binding cassette domain-containing protein [Paenibacillus sp. J5C2022]
MPLEGKGLGWRYGRGDWLFQSLNITIMPGEVVGLFGPSGSGKSTLGRLLAGYMPPMQGEVVVGGKRRSGHGHDAVQLIHQHPQLAVNPGWRMKRMLCEGWRPDSGTLAAMGVSPGWSDRFPGELSGGELQRCCIVRALGPDTRHLIADEMTAMLDAVSAVQIWHALLRIAEERRIGLLVISHDHALLERICDRIVAIFH